MNIVLVGGGHAHVHVIADLARSRPAGARVTLVTPSAETPYSGMIPGVIAGLYSRAEAHVDLARLCAARGARLLPGEAVGLDRARKRLSLKGGADVPYNIVSFDVGATPALGGIVGAREHAIAAKPISLLLDRLERLREAARAPGGPRRIVVVGGGAGGVELILAIRARLLADARADGRRADDFSFSLVTARELLPTYSIAARRRVRAALARAGVAISEQRPVVEISAGAVDFADGSRIAADATILTTVAAAPGWFADLDLPRDGAGFIATRATLQSTGDDDVFAAGDCATITASPREKAGVYAVRAGPPLAANIFRRATGLAPRAWTPQSAHMSIISTADGRAIATRGPFTFEGAWAWRWKQAIDRAWMARYRAIEPV
jgi:selenide,water dikinase